MIHFIKKIFSKNRYFVLKNEVKKFWIPPWNTLNMVVSVRFEISFPKWVHDSHSRMDSSP